MTQTAWLTATAIPDFPLAVFGQTSIYLVLICSGALFDLYRRDF
jgi:hypothetical protein